MKIEELEDTLKRMKSMRRIEEIASEIVDCGKARCIAEYKRLHADSVRLSGILQRAEMFLTPENGFKTYEHPNRIEHFNREIVVSANIGRVVVAFTHETEVNLGVGENTKLPKPDNGTINLARMTNEVIAPNFGSNDIDYWISYFRYNAVQNEYNEKLAVCVKKTFDRILKKHEVLEAFLGLVKGDPDLKTPLRIEENML